MLRGLADWFARRFGHPDLEAPDLGLGPRAIADGTSTGFALATYARLRVPHQNLVFSPYSLRAALGMAALGARGVTLQEIQSVFPPTFHRLNGIDELTVANALWVTDEAVLSPDFVDAVSRELGGRVHGFSPTDLPAATRTINDWVARHTRGRITQLVDSLQAQTALVLVNAVAFYAEWARPFSPPLTQRQVFWSEDGSTDQVPLMHQTMTTEFAETRRWQTLSLGYARPGLSLVVWLPRTRDGLATLEGSLSARFVERSLASLHPTPVQVFLPRFSISSRPHGLPDLLASIGMSTAFSRQAADFSGITGVCPPDPRALYVSDLVHKAAIDVDEQGTEATAATAIEMRAASAPLFGRRPKAPPIFRADHPFLFALCHRPTGELLFLGRVAHLRST